MKRLNLVLLGGLLSLSLACRLQPPMLDTQPETPLIDPTAAITAPTTDTALQPTAQPPVPDQPQTGGPSTTRLPPEALTYLGAFRLPAGGERPLTFEYSAGAMAFYPAGDPGGPSDGFTGSLFVTGHDRLPYGELPDGGQVAEVSIPLPVDSKDLSALPTSGFLQPFQNVAAGYFKGLDEIPRVGLTYLDTPLTGPLLHLTWGQHFQPDPPAPSHAWFNLDLTAPNTQGAWFIQDQPAYSVNGYLFEIPSEWADQFAAGRRLATGRYRDGGWSGMGPALFAYRPWNEDGSPAAPNAQLPATPLLLYANSQDTEALAQAISGYQHADEWEGGAWVTTPDGRSAVLFAGTKSTGDKFWYGYLDPANPQHPCVEVAMVGQFPICRMADGSPCPAQDLTGCPVHSDFRGWWSTRFDAQFILYDPADLARVASGELPTWGPQPYAVIDIDDTLLANPSGVESEMLGTGDMRRNRIGEVAYDRAHNLLYVLELFADSAQPVVHVWQIR